MRKTDLGRYDTETDRQRYHQISRLDTDIHKDREDKKIQRKIVKGGEDTVGRRTDNGKEDSETYLQGYIRCRRR